MHNLFRAQETSFLGQEDLTTGLDLLLSTPLLMGRCRPTKALSIAWMISKMCLLMTI